MLPSLTLGQRTFPLNLIQGPLAGISSAPFRLLATEYSAPAFAYTEMISCKTLIHAKETPLLLKKWEGEGPLGVQLSGTSPTELAEAVRIVTATGADLIDLNCGCPVNKIRRRGAGSALLSEAGKLFQLINAMKQNTHLPVSIKIRVDGDSPDRFNPDIARAITEAGTDFLIVHGRHWQDTYETPCRYEEIQYFVEALTIPVIGNGDIACEASLRAMLATGCAGAMLARATVGQPWLIGRLAATLSGQPFRVPTLEETGRLFLRHASLLSDFLGSERDAVRQTRKFCKYYARHQPWQAIFHAEVNQCDTLAGLGGFVQRYFIDKC